jgi:hypothetical protein
MKMNKFVNESSIQSKNRINQSRLSKKRERFDARAKNPSVIFVFAAFDFASSLTVIHSTFSQK